MQYANWKEKSTHCNDTERSLPIISIDKVTDLSAWMQKRRTDLMNLTPEARTYKRTRGRVRTPEEKKALALAAGKAWNEWLSSGKLVKTDKGYELYKI